MSPLSDKRYRKALVIGAGSGRDMASGILVTERLRELKISSDLAGFLTPWALHTFDGELERPVNQLTGAQNRKFIASRKEVSLASYFEPELVALNAELGLGIGRFYLFSLQYGTEVLRKQVDGLIQDNEYDVVVAVDIGGDILARRRDYPWLLTPIVDLSCLSILAGLRSQAELYLTVIAPGTDGEIPRRNLVEIFDELDGKGLVLHSEALSKGSRGYQVYERINRRISSRKGSQSNTFRLIAKVMSSTNEEISETLEKRASLNGKEWRFSFPVELKASLAKRIYHCNLKSVRAMREVEIKYENALEAFVLLKQLGVGGTEVDLAAVPVAITNGSYDETVFLLTPPERLEGKVRKEILEYGLKLTAEGKIPYSMVLGQDMQTLQLPANLDVLEKWGGFFFLFRRDSGKQLLPLL